MKKILSAVIAAGMIMGLMAGCGKPTVSNNSEVSTKVDDAATTDTNAEGQTTAGSNGSDVTGSTASGTQTNTNTPTAKTNITSNSNRVQALGSEYAKGITIGKMANNQKNVRIMWSVNWDYWEAQNTKKSPDFHIITKKVWEETVGGAVTVEVVAEASQSAYLATAIASGTAPDLIPVSDANYPSWQMTKFSKYLDSSELKEHLDFDNKELWDHAASSNYMWDGHYPWLIPLKKKDPFVLVYNKTKFDLSGEKTPMDHYLKGNWTWSTFVKTARAMTNVSKNEYGFTGYYLRSNLGTNVKKNSSKLFYFDSKDATWLRKGTEIYNFYQSTPLGARRDGNVNNYKTMIPSGVDAMCVCYLSDFKTMVLVSQENGGDELRIAPLFTWDVLGKKTIELSEKVWGYSICTAAKNPIGAAEYIRLESLIAQKIENTVEPEFGVIDSYLSKNEKEALRKLNTQLKTQKINQSDRTYNAKAGSGFTEVYDQIFLKQASQSFQALIDSIKPSVDAALKETNKIVQQYSK